jgi:uncharacterized protein (TIGR02001 family)
MFMKSRLNSNVAQQLLSKSQSRTGKEVRIDSIKRRPTIKYQTAYSGEKIMQDFNIAAKNKLAVLGSMTLITAASLFVVTPTHAQEISGNIGVVSNYVFRGITNAAENDGTAVQGGLDLETDSGFYAGWWASSLSYGTDTLNTTVENDLYFGIAGESGDFSYDFGALYYWYMDDSDASGIEPYLSIGFAGVDFGMHYMAQDVSWSNQGDMFFTLGTGFELAQGFNLGIVASYATYENSGKYIEETGKSSAFRSLDLTLSKAIAELPAEMFATYIIGGKDRDGFNQKDKVVIGFTYSF